MANQGANQDEQAHNERIKASFRQWLTTGDGNRLLREMAANDSDQLDVDLADLETALNVKRSHILQHPALYMPHLEEALLEARAHDDPAFQKKVKARAPTIGLTGTFGRHHVTPRGLTADLLGKLVCIDGIVTRCTNVSPKLVVGVYSNKGTGNLLVREMPNRLSLVTNLDAVGGQPKQDADGNEYEQEIGLSLYRDTQRITVQEMPERAPTGLLPRSVDVLLEGDLVNQTKPGERVRVSAYLKPFPKQENGATSGACKSVSVANRIERLTKEVRGLEIDPHDLRNIKKVSQRGDLLDLVGRSFAPSICGHELVKKGLVLMLLGGVEKVLANKTHLRGDINVLLIGDPSCGKSQMLRFIMHIAPLAISTTGRGSSGVGLTAAVTQDRDTGERRLEAGALVLGDRGVVLIDEFDKMSPQDRTAIHEVMEQQTVTIAKAGLHAQLNARCSVVAAANPIYGSFDDTMDLAKNINLPDSLLSRFDLVFTVRDLTEPEEDRKIARQVIRQLRFRKEGQEQARGAAGAVIEPEQPVTSNDEPTEMFQREQLYQGVEVLTVDFLRKYIHYAKTRKPEPDLSSDAVEALAEFYRDLRQRQAANPRSTVVTTRTLEAAIRLATAHAKLCLRAEVTLVDVAVAKNLILLSRGDDIEPGDQAAADAPAPEAPAGPAKRRYDDFAEAFADVVSKLADGGRQLETAGVPVMEVLGLVNRERRPGVAEFSEVDVRSYLEIMASPAVDRIVLVGDIVMLV